MKTYKSTRPFILEKPKKLAFGKNQIFAVDGKKIYVQGRLSGISHDVFSVILSMEVLVETDCSKEFIYENVILNDEYKKIQKVVSKSKKQLPKYSKQLETIHRWVFRPKGSSATNIEEEINFLNNSEEILKTTNLREGMKAKPGDVHMNRGTERHGPFVTEEDCKTWLTDDTSILAYGIRKSDYATQSEQVKIYIKVIKQVCSMEDCPKEFSDFFTTELGIVPDVEPLRDYIRLIDKTTRKDLGYPKLLFSDFDKNKHHSKENGLEFCHLDPWQDFTTNVDNITIGSSRANRLQGGYPISYIQETFK